MTKTWNCVIKLNARDFLFNTYITSCIQQPYGYNVTGQLEEPKNVKASDG